MSGANVATAATLFVLLIVYVGRYWVNRYPKELATVYRYRLFAVRDKMLRGVAEGRIDRNDESFTFLYETTNAILPSCRPLALAELLSVFQPGRMDRRAGWRAKLDRALHDDRPEVRMSARALVMTVLDILVLKSPWVRYGIVRCVFPMLARSAGVVRKIMAGSEVWRLLAGMFRELADANSLYRELSDMTPP